jgi:hypothetical protein
MSGNIFSKVCEEVQSTFDHRGERMSGNIFSKSCEEIQSTFDHRGERMSGNIFSKSCEFDVCKSRSRSLECCNWLNMWCGHQSASDHRWEKMSDLSK